jgi:hypothetical protein
MAPAHLIGHPLNVRVYDGRLEDEAVGLNLNNGDLPDFDRLRDRLRPDQAAIPEVAVAFVPPSPPMTNSLPFISRRSASRSDRRFRAANVGSRSPRSASKAQA